MEFNAQLFHGSVTYLHVWYRTLIKHCRRRRKIRLRTALEHAAVEIKSDGTYAGHVHILNARGLFTCPTCHKVYQKKTAMLLHERDFTDIKHYKSVVLRGASMAMKMLHENDLAEYSSDEAHRHLPDVKVESSTT